MIVFEKLRYKNLLSTGNSWTEFNLNEYKTNLIIGRNGAGKCLHPGTTVNVFSDDSEVEKAFEEYLKSR